MDKKTIQAIKDSIKHWEKDFVERFKRRDFILSKKWHNGDDVKWGSRDCALCGIFWAYDTICDEKCPLNTKNKGCCDIGSPYENFTENPCLETAEAMVKTLESLLEDK